MNKNYKNKKRVTIIILSVLAVCLFAGLICGDNGEGNVAFGGAGGTGDGNNSDSPED